MCYICTQAEQAREAAKAKEAPASRTLEFQTVRRFGPCWEYRSKLQERYPESVEVTVELAVSQANDWDWYWAAENLLTTDGYHAFCDRASDAERERQKVIEPYNNVRRAMRQAMKAEYDRVRREEIAKGVNEWDAGNTASKLYYKLTDMLPNVYDLDWYKEASQKRVEAWARAWAEIYISEEGLELDHDPETDEYYDDEPQENDYYDENEDY